MALSAKKSLGQNFLKSSLALRVMIEESSLDVSDTVLEIGPGKGALTRALLATKVRVVAVELDERMVEYLNEIFAPEIASGQLTLVHASMLETNIRELLGGVPYKVVANIPYYITNALIRYFLESEYQPRLMCLLVQYEVAQRIVAKDAKESILSLSVKIYGTPRKVMKVSRNAFTPKPKVDSAILSIKNISRNNIPSPIFEHNFFVLVKNAFAHKRKQAFKNLLSLFPKDVVEHVFTTQGISSTVRAEDISFDTWKALTQEITATKGIIDKN